MKTQSARATFGAEEVLFDDRRLHRTRDGNELSRFQPDEGPNIFRRDPRGLTTAAATADHAHDQ